MAHITATLLRHIPQQRNDPSPLPCARCKRESIQSHCVIAERRTRRFKLDALASRQAEQSQAIGNVLDTIVSSGHSSGHGNVSSESNLLQDVIGTDTNGSPSSPSPSHTSRYRGPPLTALNRGQSVISSRQSQQPEEFILREAQGYQRGGSIDTNRSRSQGVNAQRNLTDNVIHTLVSKPNDALTLLFEAAGREDMSALTSRRQSADPDRGNQRTEDNLRSRELGNNGPSPENAYATPHSTKSLHVESLPSPSTETLELWKKCRFVRQGWLSASQAILYVDLFFVNLSPLSPIISDYYADHSHHHALINSEPLLCATIFTISSRYHVLPGEGGMLRSDDIHRKFWLHWKKLYTLVLYGQESKSKNLRAVGTVESLLLMTEWHPRALHFPLDVDTSDDEMPEEDEDEMARMDEASHAHMKSAAEIEGAARRSDRFSWMLLGSALTLAHELGISDQRLQDRDLSSAIYNNAEEKRHAEFLEIRRSRPRRLLYICINQLASRLGWSSMIPRIISDSAEQSLGGEAEKQWYNVMSRWISLTRLMKTASDMLFSSIATKQLLRTGNYVTSLEHFGHLLQDWQKEYDSLVADQRLLDIMFIEFQFTRTYINSLAVQAVVDRALKSGAPATGPTEFVMTCVFERHSIDWGFIQEVVDGSRKILKKVLELNESGHLRYCPVRIFSRIISASILLLKATGLGARVEEAQISLELLDQLINALRFDPVDELHLANRYASLLETHVKAFRRRFFRVGRSRDGQQNRESFINRSNSSSSLSEQQRRQFDASNFTNVPNSATAVDPNLEQMMADGGIGGFPTGVELPSWEEGMAAATAYRGDLSDDWMCLPLDAFDPTAGEFSTTLGAGGLDFFYMGTM
ncbi:hypothetical protein G7Y89_g8772 [Cudoniella acicularis]|uniref:Transcription factor domain-containing protein n=1 Tax=Cudoniella acicularis TaxID=354080 RepID=A0A8H4RJN9_9HELO|nr:hypothetical protein G7Y89_g8772 [Cudoniella acicularis]